MALPTSLRHARLFSALATVAVLAACGSSPSGGGTPSASVPPTAAATTTSTSTGASSATSSTSTDTCAVAHQSPPQQTVATSFPTALAFAPDGRLFWTERSGTVKLWQDGAARTFATVRTVTSEPGGGYSERGLLGLALSPHFAADHWVYAFYSDADYAHQHVIRWTDCAGHAGDARVIITLPAGGDCCHKGGRLAAGADGKLYVTLGDEHTSSAAQNTSDPRGKVLRYNLDGSIPADNPFGAGNPVYAYGLRNPFGLAISATGQIAVSANGPTGDAGSPGTGYDTVILSVGRGAGYQWPLCYGYSHPLASSTCGGKANPDWSSESSTVVPTGMAFVDSRGPAPFAGHLVMCTFTHGMLVFSPGSPHATTSTGPSQCTTDVKESPDGALYYADTGHIYRLA